VPTFVDRGVSRGQHGGFPSVVRSIPIQNSNRVNRDDSIQCNGSKSESELEQLNNTKNDIPVQSELNPNQGNPCIDNQYNKRKLLIFHQNI
jgi:hypothetical protein